jgi:hypothetical protein
MWENFKLLALELKTIGLLDGLGSFFLFIVLNVADSSTRSIVVAFKLALDDVAILWKEFVESLLVHASSDVFNEDVGLGVWLKVGLDADGDNFTVDVPIIKGFLASLCLLLCFELGITVQKGFFVYDILHDFSSNYVETILSDELKKVEVKEIGWQVAKV